MSVDAASCQTGSSSGGAKRAPVRKMRAEMTRKMRVAPRPMLRLERSEMAPMICGENVSPKKWMQNRLMEMAVARTGAETELTIAVFSGPVLRNRKNSARNSAGTEKARGPKKMRAPNGMVRTTLQKESR